MRHPDSPGRGANVGLLTEEPHPGFAAVGAFADVPSSRRADVSTLVRAELGRLALHGPSEEELELVRGQAMQSVAEEARSNDHLLDRTLRAVAAGRLPQTPRRRAARLQAITREDLRRVARAWLDLSRTFEVAVVPSAG